MASAFSHAIVALAMGRTLQHRSIGWREGAVGALVSVVPDLDVAGLAFGIAYGDLWGHRGMTHSVLFAALIAGSLVAVWYRSRRAVERAMLFLYFFLCTASHGVLDAMTDGGLGVAFLSPFDTTRYFFPWRPILVSPIGITDFFSLYGFKVMLSEAVWIWLPACALFLLVCSVWRARSARSVVFPSQMT